MDKEQLPTSSYIIGKLIGEIIYLKYLPTLNIDLLRTNKVINVAEEEKKEIDELNKLYVSYMHNKDYKLEASKAFKILRYKHGLLAKKYLPNELECYFDKITVYNTDDFKKGLTDYLWNTDLSWYDVGENFFVQEDYHTKIILTLRIDEE